MEVNGLLEKDELEHIRKIFNKFDLKGDGNITFDVPSK
jgi:Ca2+-binding EF-hand superfamily protein